MATSADKYLYDPNVKPFMEDTFGLGIENRLNTLNRPAGTVSTKTATGTREQYKPGVSFTSSDPLQGTFLEEGAIFGLDPLGIFDVPQIEVDIERLSPDYLSNLVSTQARRNALQSMALEREIDPFTAASRDQAMKNLFSMIEKGAGGDTQLQDFFAQMMTSKMEAPQLQQSQLLQTARQKALEDLNLGYELPQDVRNLVMRTAAGRTSGAGTMGGLGRDIGARDLGLTSLSLFDKRMERASGLGVQEEQTNIGQQGLKASIDAQNRQFQFGAAQGLQGQRQQDYSNQMGFNQFLQGIDRPMAGIDPGALASFMVADINQRNQLVNQANIAQLQSAVDAKGNQLDIMGDVMGMMGGFCWVAREVYQDPRWKLFRLWMINESDDSFFNWYVANGERFAEYLKVNPFLKPAIRSWMDKKIQSISGNRYGFWVDSLIKRLGRN